METKDNLTMTRVIVVIAIIALLLGIVAVGLNRVPGPQGEQGIPGQSIKGDKGDTGEKGDKGDTGKNGINGTDGDDGKDAPINKIPSITKVSLDGQECCHKYVYELKVNVHDSDNDVLKVSFYYGSQEAGPWKKINVFFGRNGNYSTVKYLCESTVYLLVEVLDGSDRAIATYSYTVAS